jgi:peptidoglycan DL-endopeptidase CwlO
MTNVIVTAYCACSLCCGPSAPNKTASGVWPKQGITIAAPRNIPLSTRVTIIGMTNIFIVQDRTARRFNGRWDIFFTSHSEAKKFGKQKRNVTILK